MFYMPLGEYWLGPTRYTWADNQCGTLQFDNGTEEILRDDVGACKEECEKKVSCNAITAENTICDGSPCIKCILKNCTFPVPAPCGPRRECIGNNLEDPDYRGYYRATGKKEIYI